MPKNLTIPKDTSSFPEYLNWELLRNTGIKHIENLGSDLWTDYNLHDPGITILEVLCYALTDLGYRTHLDIKDILARSPEDKNQAIKTAFEKPRDNNFFTAAEILSCNPVTLNDFRKLLIDVPGVKNAWLILAAEGEVPIVLSKNKDKLAKDNYELVFANQEPGNNKRIKIQGLFEVVLELEALPVRDACGSIIFTKNGILETVHKKLNAHRNLCEDIKKISIFGEEQIQICANIELESSANPEQVLLEMYKKLEEHLSPTLPFYTLQEMLKKGRSMEEIFEGRPLSTNSNGLVESNGFIDTIELERIIPQKSLFTSDFYRIIMDINGVIAIRELTLSNAIDGVVINKGEKWCLNLTPRYRPHFHLKASQITFYKGRLPFTTDTDVVSQRYLEERVAKAKAKLEGYQLDLPIPEGQHRPLEDYTSITEDFPLTFGVGSDGLKGLNDAKRKGQAKQLKAYLLFFDQFLANYLSQLANVRELFSLNSDESRAGKTHTYFTQILSEVPGIKDLLINFHECENNDEDGVPPEDFPSYLKHIAENLKNYQSRRTRFLDHLLARFSESFSDYVLLMYEMNGKQHENIRIIKNKADFLSGYPDISRNRGKAFNYTLPVGCKVTNPCNKTLDKDEKTVPENISGLEKRVAKLIGIENTFWTTLGNAIIEEQTSGWKLIIQRHNNPFLKSKAVWESEAATCEVLKGWDKYLGNEQYIKRLTYEVKDKKEYVLVVKKENGKEIAIGTQRFSSLKDCSKTRDEIHSSIKDIAEQQIAHETINGTSYFVIKDEEGIELIRFDGKEEDSKDFRDNIKDKKLFCKKTILLNSVYEHGFIIVNDQEECLAQSANRYSDEEEREEAIFWLIGQIRWAGLSGGAIGEKECYAFQLVDFRDDQLLLQSEGGFPSISETMAFFNPEEQEQEGLLHWATLHENYQLLEKDGKYSFSIKNGMGKTVSIHPSWYDSEIEVLHLRDAIIYYLKNGSPETEINGTPGDFEFEISDAAGNILFIGFGTYPTIMEARSASSLVKVLARHRRYYKPVEREEELPYGFELVNRSDVSFAGHPHWYATACERDLAMDAIINYAENLNPQYQITEKENKFYLNLLGPDGNDLLFGTTGYSDKDTAEANWQHFLDRATKKENFKLTDSGDTKYPSGFQLLDDNETEMAKSSSIYATEAESKMALLSIVYLVSHTDWSVAITGDPGDYHYWIGDGIEKKFLESFQEYPDEGSARLGLKKVLDLGQNPDNYHQTKKFGIKLKDAEGKVIASHPTQYENEAQVKMAVFKVVSFLRKDDPRMKIPNIGGAFRTVIFEEGGKIALKGTTIHSNKAKALDELDEILEFAGIAAHYKQQEDELKRCQNGFYLVNKEGEAIATHPYHYLTPQDRDEKMAAVFGRLTHAEKIKKSAVKKKSLFSFQLSGQSKVASHQTFDQEEDVWEAFNDFLEAGLDFSRYLPNKVEAKHGFIILSPTGTTLAHSLTEFESEQERDNAMREVWLNIRMKATGFRVFQDDEQEKWHFALEDQEGRDFLIGNLYKDSEQEAIYAKIKAFDMAQNKGQYLSRKDEEEETFTFDLLDEEGTILARYAKTGFDTEEALAESIEQYLHFLSEKKPVPTIVETKVNYFFELTDFAENVILSAVKNYSTIETATSDWLKMAEATEDSSNVEIVYDNNNCRYTVYLKEENEVLGQSTQKITSRTQAERWIELIRLILQKQDPHGDAIGTACGFHFILTPPESEEALKDIQIKGANRFPTSSEALRESEKVVEMLGDDQLFLAEKKGDQWQLSLYDEDEKFMAILLPLLEDEAEALETRDLLRTFLETGGMLECGDDGKAKADEVEVSYRSIIKKEEKSYLESSSFNSEEEAEAASNTIHEWGQTENRYNLITNEEECLYSFELTDEYGISLATHPTFYKRDKDRDEALQKTLTLISGEGLRLVEHILLRPRNEGLHQFYRFKLVDTDTNIPVLEGETSYSSEEETWEAFRKMWVAFQESSNESRRHSLIDKLDDLEAPCQFSFNIIAPDGKTIVARSTGAFDSQEKRDKQLKELIQIFENLRDEPENAPELPNNLVAKVYPLRLDYDLLGCKLMIPIMDHYIPGSSVDPKYVDPYSFRATVVLPYWPTRFQKPEFRQFIETTLRKEAPAHVFLRICWVDTKDMKDFEDAYCTWLSTIQLGSDACKSIEAKNNLVTTLCKLRSVYPVASLHDCQAPSEDSNRIVLNYSIIGSANS